MGRPRSSTSADVIVVGGGVAGLSVTAALAGQARVLLLERESLLASHASGHNAAIYRPLEDDQTSAWLAQRSLWWLSDLVGTQVLSRTGLLLASSDPERTRKLAQRAVEQGVAHEWLDRAELHAAEPALQGGEASSALCLPGGGVLDIHALTTGLTQRARERNAVIRTGACVQRVCVEQGRVRGVVLEDGTQLTAAAVVLCAGAWAGGLGLTCGVDEGLVPLRRHLVLLRTEAATRATQPVLWRLEDEVYFRPESGGLLASPCDEAESAACVPTADPAELIALARKLERFAPGLSKSAVQRSWACLRTFAPDRELVAGPDPRVAGLHWLAGLGGRGMSVAPAVGELLAQVLLGQPPHPLLARFGPGRRSSASSLQR